jgi:predicted membrane-bound dolichyl-phosphate-mannose-protein mannosyltransferase
MELFSKHRLGLAIRENSRRYYRWEYFWLSVIVIGMLIIHFSLVLVPKDIILDEIHYIKDARSISDNAVTQRVEHPPLGKLIIVGGMKTFGDNPWGWRVIPIICGTLTIIMFYLICRRFDMSRTSASIAVFLLATENLFFLLSSLAMLDVYYVMFMMASFLLYAYKRYFSSGVAIGLSALSKLNGALAGPAVAFHWLFSRRWRSKWFMLTVIMAIIVFFAGLPIFDMIISRDIHAAQDPVKQSLYMLQLTGSLTFENVDHPSEAPPWQWLYDYKPMPFNYMPHWTAAISFSVWVAIVPTFLYMLWRAIKKNQAALFGLGWFFATYLIWIPATFITDRVTYIYYFYPAVGAVCLGMGLWMGQLWDIFRRRPRGKLKWFAFSVVILFLAAHVFSFLILSPIIQVDFAKLVGLTTVQP